MKSFISLTISILLFIALLVGFSLTWYVSILIGVIVYLLSETVQRTGLIMKKRKVDIPVSAHIDTLFMTGMKRIRQMEHYASGIEKVEVKERVRTICQLGEQIFTEVEDKPETISLLRRFLNYYLESAEKVTMLYEKLSKSAYQSEETMETLDKVEDTLLLIQKQFEKQIMKIQQDDVMNLDVEVKVLERTLLSEGLDLTN